MKNIILLLIFFKKINLINICQKKNVSIEYKTKCARITHLRN